AAGAHLGGALVLRGAATRTGAPELAVAAVQPNVPQDRKWEEGSAARILDDLERLTREAAAGGAVLIAWPESASPYAVSLPLPDPRDGGRAAPHSTYVERLEKLVDVTGARLVVGTVDYRMTPRGLRAANSARIVTPGEGLGPAYDKIHLVPFGEYVPLARLLFFVERLAGGAIADFDPGERLEPLPTPWGAAAVFICYEAIFPDLVRRLAGSDATLLVNLTNDAWFGRTSAPYQHLAMAAVRAAELRRPLLRAANTGISALVDPYGRIVARTRLMETAILSGRVTPRSGRTPYARAGDAFAWACAILGALLALATRARPARP
ncbi:MAG: apolipoprotein N-acyltransferase, partial [Candidatus Polarisedimenticolia bacterium]